MTLMEAGVKPGALPGIIAAVESKTVEAGLPWIDRLTELALAGTVVV